MIRIPQRTYSKQGVSTKYVWTICCRPPKIDKFRAGYFSEFSEILPINPYHTTSRQPPREFARLEVDSKLLSNLIKIKINLTGTVRICYNINVVFGKPFNRTSLELKQTRSSQPHCRTADLLIEPVWN